MKELVIFCFCVVTVSSCNIETLLQGTFHRQVNQGSNFSLGVVHFEKIVVSASSASTWGDCYEKVDLNSFIFGLKRIGKATCFRCITLIPKTPNVMQSLHQSTETCHDVISDAKRSCFDPSAVGPGDGELLFRVENTDHQSCGLEGNFVAGYQRVDEPGLKCDLDSGTEMQNCNSKEELYFKFRNCTFPEFDQRLTCLGTWPAMKNENFVAFFDQDTRQYRCGKLISNKRESQLLLSGDATCSKLTNNIAFEKYSFIEKNKKQVFTSCQFPEWLQGEYDGMSIRADEIRYKLPNSPSLVSSCIEIDNERILVHSETSCGEPIGYHCLWFKPRSNSVIEFKTTTIANEATGICRKEDDFTKAVWTALISKTAKKSPCAYFGTYSTPKNMQINDCYNLTVDCKKRDRFKIIAYHCQNGIAYDVKDYDCYGTWKEDDNLFVYAKTHDSQSENVCMTSRQQGEYLYFSILGNHCDRHFNFSENSDSVLVLKRASECSKPKLKQVVISTEFPLMISSTPSTRRLSPPRKAFITDPQLAQQNNSYSSSASLATILFIIFELLYQIQV